MVINVNSIVNKKAEFEAAVDYYKPDTIFMSEKFISILYELQGEAAREANVLDLFITNRPALVKHISTVLGVSDDDGAIIADSDVIPAFSKKQPRKIFIFSKAHWQNMKDDVADFGRSFLVNLHTKTTDQNWNSIKECIQKTIEDNVPSK